MSRPPTQRRTQGAFHSAPRAEGGAGTSRADAVRWGTVATSATLPRDHPGEDDGRDALVASAYGTWNTGDIPFSTTRRGRSMGHGRDKRDPPARPSRKTNGRDALVASAYGTWNTGGIPFSATRRGRSMGYGRDKRDPPARPSRKTNGRDALVASAYGTWRPPTHPAWGTSRDPPRAKNKARREHASGRTELAEGGGFEPPIR